MRIEESGQIARVAAVIVTYNRRNLLSRCLDAVLGQSRLPDVVYVVDNASTDGTAEMIASKYAGRVLHELLSRNVGGAGGFQRGIELAFAGNYDWIWVMDDDGVPHRDCLEGLIRVAVNSALDSVAPSVVAEGATGDLAFTLSGAGGVARTLLDVQRMAGSDSLVLRDTAAFFNGVLLSHAAVERVGVPDGRFFIYGDEVEYFQRLRSAGLRVGTAVDCLFEHPAKSDTQHVVGALLSISYSGIPLKDYCFYRNRAYINLRYGFYREILVDLVRYVIFFLVRRREMCRFFFVLRASCDGFRGRFGRERHFLEA